MSSTRCHTFTGRGFDPLNPRSEDVCLVDIAHHLAMTCRFGGATPFFYSVAQHAVSVARLVMELSEDPLWALHGLHHDSAEAYIHDIRRPIKSVLRVRLDGFRAEDAWTFEQYEGGIQREIFLSLGLGWPVSVEAENMTRDADNAMLRAEMLWLFGEDIGPVSMIDAGGVRDCMDWPTAKAAFLAAHHDLMAQIGRGV